MRRRLEISPLAVAGWCIAFYLLPWRSFTGLALCCAVHEAAHAALVLAGGGLILRFRLGADGAEIAAAGLSRGWELAAVLAGPASNLLLSALLLPLRPETALMSLALGCFNLLPFAALDGDRALSLLAGGTRAERRIRRIAAALLICAALLLALHGWNRAALLCACLPLLRAGAKTRLHCRAKEGKMEILPKKSEV